MTTTREIAEYLDEKLETATVPDYGSAVNGLQMENSGKVTRIAAAVDFSSRTVSEAVREKADLLIVHHGMFWRGTKPFAGAAYQSLRMLVQNDIAVYSSHLPLDRDPIFGNNVLLSSLLGLTANGEFATVKGVAIGLRGDSDIETSVLLDQARAFAKKHSGDAISNSFAAGRRTKRWAVCTGAGASSETLQEASELGVDTLIVGEGPHHTAVEADELGIVVIYAGHYATETLGVAALAEHLAEKFGLEWTMIHAPTGL